MHGDPAHHEPEGQREEVGQHGTDHLEEREQGGSAVKPPGRRQGQEQ
jgi:hypothetical protein